MKYFFNQQHWSTQFKKKHVLKVKRGELNSIFFWCIQVFSGFSTRHIIVFVMTYFDLKWVIISTVFYFWDNLYCCQSVIIKEFYFLWYKVSMLIMSWWNPSPCSLLTVPRFLEKSTSESPKKWIFRFILHPKLHTRICFLHVSCMSKGNRRKLISIVKQNSFQANFWRVKQASYSVLSYS